MTENNRKSTSDYWEENWSKADSRKEVYGARNLPAERLYGRLGEVIGGVLPATIGKGSRFLELGCGGSRYMPFFAKRFGWNVTGLDYTQRGCESAVDILKSEDVQADVVFGDMFDPPEGLLSTFDVVGSFGLVEHFDNTSSCVASCARYLRSGGVLVTMIPNMAGLYGSLFKLVDRRAFDLHVPLTPTQLEAAHKAAGLTVKCCVPLLGMIGIFDPGRREPRPLVRFMRRVGFAGSTAYFWLEDRGLGIPSNAFTSPYILCVATAP